MFKHLLVPLDGSPLAEKALPATLEIASRFDSEITLLRVIQPPYVLTNVGGSNYAALFTALRDQAEEEAKSYLTTQQNSLRQQGYQVHAQMVNGDPIAEIILQVAETTQADMIVMSTHGRGGLSRWVYGSVADRILRHANIPVLLIRNRSEVH